MALPLNAATANNTLEKINEKMNCPEIKLTMPAKNIKPINKSLCNVFIVDTLKMYNFDAMGLIKRQFFKFLS